MEDLTGIRIDRYQIEKVIGSGGMAIVYLAQDVILKRRVALKIIRKAAFPPKDYERLRKRFLIEAQTLAL